LIWFDNELSCTKVLVFEIFKEEEQCFVN
jgi:hypothetical protein